LHFGAGIARRKPMKTTFMWLLLMGAIANLLVLPGQKDNIIGLTQN